MDDDNDLPTTRVKLRLRRDDDDKEPDRRPCCIVCLFVIEDDASAYPLDCDPGKRHVCHAACAADLIAKGNGRCPTCRHVLSSRDVELLRPFKRRLQDIEGRLGRLSSASAMRAVLNMTDNILDALLGEDGDRRDRKRLETRLRRTLRGDDGDGEEEEEENARAAAAIAAAEAEGAAAHHEEVILEESDDEDDGGEIEEERGRQDPDYLPGMPDWWELTVDGPRRGVGSSGRGRRGR